MNAPARKVYDSDPAMEDWVDRARSTKIGEVADMLGARLKKITAAERAGPCPLCQGEDGFAINVRSNVFNCRRGGVGGDGIAMMMHVQGCDFVEACERIVGEPPPRRGSQVRPVDPAIERERREERREAKIEEVRQEAKEKSAAIIAATRMFEQGEPFGDSYAEAYLERRGIRLRPDQVVNLRFVAALPYWGFPEPGVDDMVELGAFPAMIAAIRNADMDIIGIHRTWIDPERPRKLQPPGDKRRNASKKVFRQAAGGLIWLGEPAEFVCMGEGIESTASYLMLPDVTLPDTVVAAAGVSLGNIAGRSTGTQPHPTHKNRTVCNGEPDLEAPGIIFPEITQHVRFLGDADSDPAETRAKILCGMRRVRAQGKTADAHFPADGTDWNVVLMEMLKGAAS